MKYKEDSLLLTAYVLGDRAWRNSRMSRSPERYGALREEVGSARWPEVIQAFEDGLKHAEEGGIEPYLELWPQSVDGKVS